MSIEKTIYFACDGFGETLKEAVKTHVESSNGGRQKVKIVDFGSDTYYDAAAAVGKALAKSENKNDMGVLVCGTGMGVGIMANKFPDVRAATCENLMAVRCSRAVNDSNVLCLGQLVTTPEDAKAMADEFLFKQDFISHPKGDDGKPLPWWNKDVETFLKTSKAGMKKVEMEAKNL
ncbi:MAG: hypothetical protein SGBAC_011639 [Bacillariaceae sp.]